jgi:pyruvate-formate lyase-activating enzyme
VSIGSIGLAYTDRRGRIFFDEGREPLADGGIVRPVLRAELIRAPRGTVSVMLPGRSPLLRRGTASRRTVLGALLPAGYTRLLLPAYEERDDAPALPLFGYAFACAIGDELHVAAARTDEDPNWTPRTFAEGELEKIVAARLATDSGNRILAQLARCSLEYGCFTAQNVFLERGEAAITVSPKCNARCVGCISELDADAGIPSPQERITYEVDAEAPARIAIHHLERVPDGIVSFGQGCEGEPLLRATTIARAIGKIRQRVRTGTINLNTNGSLPKSLQRLIDAGLDAVRISLNSFRTAVYAAYYRPIGYELDDVLESVRRAARAGLRVSLNLLTHPGVTDDAAEVAAMTAFLRDVPVALVQTRTLNIDPHRYFALAGRPKEPLGMRTALAAIRTAGVAVGNFTHTH